MKVTIKKSITVRTKFIPGNSPDTVIRVTHIPSWVKAKDDHEPYDKSNVSDYFAMLEEHDRKVRAKKKH